MSARRNWAASGFRILSGLGLAELLAASISQTIADNFGGADAAKLILQWANAGVALLAVVAILAVTRPGKAFNHLYAVAVVVIALYATDNFPLGSSIIDASEAAKARYEKFTRFADASFIAAAIALLLSLVPLYWAGPRGEETAPPLDQEGK